MGRGGCRDKPTLLANSGESDGRNSAHRGVSAGRRRWLLQHWFEVRRGEKTGRDFEGLRNGVQDRISCRTVEGKEPGNRVWCYISLRQEVLQPVERSVHITSVLCHSYAPAFLLSLCLALGLATYPNGYRHRVIH
jgi:hypothetical protein